MRNPCLTCEVHLLGHSKNTDRCGNCGDRLRYLDQTEENEAINMDDCTEEGKETLTSVKEVPDSVPLEERTPEDNTRICKDCEIEKPLTGEHFQIGKGSTFFKICRVCMKIRQRKGFEKRTRPKKNAKKPEEKKGSESFPLPITVGEPAVWPKDILKPGSISILQPGEPVKSEEGALVVMAFPEEHMYLFDWLQEEAKKNFRSIENQAKFLIKQCKAMGMGFIGNDLHLPKV